MPTWGTILLTILKVVLTSKVCRKIAADQIEILVKSTETKVDDAMAKPILDYLRK